MGLVVLIGLVVLLMNSGSNEDTPPRDEARSRRETPPVNEARPNVPTAPKKQDWELEEERLSAELRQKFQPDAIRNDSDWKRFVSLVEKAEGLCGISKGDSRESVIGRTEEQLKEAKRAVEQAEEVIGGNAQLRSLTREYGSVLSSDTRFDFVQDWISRHGGLKLKLKGVKAD